MTTKRLTLLVASLCVCFAANVASAGAYGWPVRPFDRQHPVRGYFGDPRIAPGSHSLHFGVDVSASNGTPVFATVSGRVSIHPRHADTVLVQSGAITFEYWHVVPAIRSGHAVAYRTIVGHVEKPWAHVHFAERFGSTYLNPLRRGAMRPYGDRSRPGIDAVQIVHAGNAITMTLDAHDRTPLLVPAPWSNLPVAPALVEWRVHRRGRPAPWRVAADFRTTLPTAAYGDIYDAATTQNHVRRPGTYRFTLVRSERLTHGRYVIEARVSDTAGNTATAKRTMRVR